MSNDFFNASGSPSLASGGSSAVIRAEFDAVMAGFAKLPVFTANANKPIVVNSGATAMEPLGSTVALAGNFALTGTYAITLAAAGSVNTTLPAVSGTLFTTTGTVTLTNKTFASPAFAGITTGTYTIGGTPTYPSGTTLTSPVLSGNITGTYTIGGTPTFTNPTVAASTFTSPVFKKITVSSGPLTLTSGQIQFPSSLSVDTTGTTNALGWYKEGTWTPTLTFATPGNVSVSYTTQLGAYTRIGQWVTASFVIVTSAFTHTTAADSLYIGGFPFKFTSTGWFEYGAHYLAGPCTAKGFTATPTTRSSVFRVVGGSWFGGNTDFAALEYATDSAWASVIQATEHTSGTNVTLYGTVTYPVIYGS